MRFRQSITHKELPVGGHAGTCVAKQLCGLQVTKLSTEGQVKQYAEQRIAELQDLIAASL